MKKTAIVTGAAGNLGSAVIKKFEAEGYSVTGIYHRTPLPGATPGNTQVITADLTNALETETAITQWVEKHGNIDVAVLTAGGFKAGNIFETDSDLLQSQYQLNFESTYFIARQLFIQMHKQNSGTLILTSSQSGLHVNRSAGSLAYALSKSLVFQLGQALQTQAKGTDVTVKVLAPATIDTPQNRQAMPDADTSNWITPAEIAQVLHYHCTDTGRLEQQLVIKV